VYSLGAVLVPPMQGWTPLTAACIEGHVKIVKLLLKAGSDVDKEDGIVSG
jgi:ankyrin repeat protein